MAKNKKIKIKDSDKGISLALGGGGARGFGHIGVLEVLEKEGIKIERLAGTSMGAVVAAMYSVGYSIEKMKEIAFHFGEIDIVPTRYLNIFHESILKPDFIEDALNHIFKDLHFKDCKIPLQIVAVDLETGKDVVFDDGTLRKVIMASVSIPLLFPPTFYHDKYLVDGAVLNNVPLTCLREKNPKLLMGIKLVNYTSQQYISGMVYAKYHQQKYKNLFKNVNFLKNFLTNRRQDISLMVGIALRAMDIAARDSTEARIKASKPDVLLEPQIQCGPLEFNKVADAIEEGRRVTQEAIPRLKELMKEKGLL
ncbi:patatin-like phospholipase family protein [Patescibacteria group bacterium]|nr:patatin-like phospholipase family protein [Patescibacteria group bacterium]